MVRTNPKKPDYYLYQKDGVWFKTDDSLTKNINENIAFNAGHELPAMEFYPNWNVGGKEKFVAWRVNRFGEQVVRWYWKVADHGKNCGACVKLSDIRCATKTIAMIEWNTSANCWQLCPMEDKASNEEAKILDKR